MISKYKGLLDQSPNPGLAELRLERLLQEDSVRQYLQENPIELVRVFIHIIAVSNFLFHYLCRQPEVINLIGSEQSELSNIDKVTNVEGLRSLKYRELLRITSLDIGNKTSYEHILLALSDLADKILIKLLTLVEEDGDIKWAGKEVPLSLIAMGKLGAQELNYSSDVDLICVCANNEDISGDVNEYHSAVIQRIRQFARNLEEITSAGFLYRVDLNLRPWGRSAPLVMSIDDTEHYYEASTEAWERFAWLRARFVAGSELLGVDMLERLHPFKYRQTLGPDDLERFIDIKDKMAAVRRKEGCWNVKMGEGGIRDIEFFIQVLQIVNARHHPGLQQTNTLKILTCMVEIGLVDIDEAENIRESYLFLRRLENRLQMIDELQVHDLPDEKEERLIIVRSLGFAGDSIGVTLEKFDQYLSRQRNVARECFDKILLKRTGNIMLSTGAIQKALEMAMATAWHEDVARSSMDRWLALCDKNHWHQCPENLDLLATLFGASWYFTRFVFLRGRKIVSIFDDAPPLDFTSASLIDDFLQALAGDDQETQFEALKIAKNETMLAILLAQLSKTYKQEEIESALTALAEATLFCVIQILVGDDVEVKDNIAILAMGRMAGYEMNFGSDLDLIFLYSGGSQELGFKISSFVRKLMRNIGLLSPAGLLYEVDMRLRPHGNSGVLVTGEQSFIDYHKGEREVWERQMMTRCRVVFDSGNFASSALAKVTSSVYQEFDDNHLRSEIANMRKLVVAELGSRRGKYDLKRGEGGIMDIDFLTHYLQLLHGYEDKSLRTTSTRQALRKLTEAGRINKENSDCLLDAYDYLKTIESHLRVFDMKSISTFSKESDKIAGLVRSMNYLDDNTRDAAKAFLDDYRNTAQSVRQIFKDIFSLV